MLKDTVHRPASSFAAMKYLVAITAVITLSVTPMQGAPHSCDSLGFEARFTYQLNQASSFHDASMVVSDALIPLAVGTPLILYLYGVVNIHPFSGPHRQDTWRYTSESGLQLGVTLAATYGVTLLAKNLIGRLRPYQAYPDCITGYDNDSDGSMPSGHAAGSAAIATTLILRYPTWYVAVPSIAYALYTGFARMNLGMHYLTDVLTGYALGVGISFLVNALNDELFDLADPILPTASISATSQLIHVSFAF
jgi:membrane-associated phospholipid phosphatase